MFENGTIITLHLKGIGYWAAILKLTFKDICAMFCDII